MDEYRVAVHEAGHALVAYLQGVEITEATIEPTDDYEGQVSGEVPDFNGVNFDHDDAQDELRTLFGGGEAENLVFGDRQPSPTDQEKIKNLSDSAPINLSGVSDPEICMDQAREMLEEHRTVLESLAEYFLEEGTVSGEDVEAFLDEKTK